MAEPFGAGPHAVAQAVAHLGYVQIDTINVIERCHHHILYNRIPAYRRADLENAQATAKTVFEYWTHALAYIATDDFRFFAGEMKRQRKEPDPLVRRRRGEGGAQGHPAGARRRRAHHRRHQG